MSKGGGGGGVQQSESVVTQTNLPEYAKPFYEEMLGRTVYESTRPYETYQGARIADFNPFETTAMTGMAEMAAAGAPQQIRSGKGHSYPDRFPAYKYGHKHSRWI